MDEQVAKLLREMTLEEKITLTIGRDFWSTNGVKRLNVRPINLNDGPHGVRKPPTGGELGLGNSIPATCFPTAMALANSWDTELLEAVGQALGEEALALDTQVLLGPGVNIKRTPLGGRSFEYFSEDPALAGELGAALVQGLQSQGVGASLKHYACNNQEYERMSISAEVDQRTLREIYLPAFERVVKKANPWTVMAAYNRVNGVFATESHQLLTEILKQEWGYKGVVVSDWGAVNDKAACLAAGMDLEMPGPGSNHTETIAALVHDGKLDEGMIDAAAGRVLDLILKGNASRQESATYDQAAHHALARRAAAESIVLLKNDGGLLPLKPDKLKSVAVIGRFAKEPRYQGSGSSQVVPTQLDNAYDELAVWLGEPANLTYAEGYTEDEQPDGALLQAAVQQAQAASLALLFVGLPGSFESEGFDRTSIGLPASHDRLVEEVCKVQPNTVVVLHNGSVVAMPWLDEAGAVLEAGLGGQAVGGAVVDVLAGKVNPSGKLAETFPWRLEDTPAYLNYPGEAGQVRYGEGLYVGYRYYDKKKVMPLLPFGFGLSYTTFEYEKIVTSREEVGPGEGLEVTVNVRNSGQTAGKEIVQLYVRPLDPSYSGPEKGLKAFGKVEIQPGATAQVKLTLEERDFMLYDTERQAWRVAGESFEILVGASSQQLPLKAAVQVKADPRSYRRVLNRLSPMNYFLENPKGREILEGMVKGTPFEEWLDNPLLNSIPIGKLSNFGGVPEAVIENIITQVNQSA